MRKRIGLVANDIHFGLAYQRGHIFFQHLRDEFDFVLLSHGEMGKAEPHYLDAVVMFHPYSDGNLTFASRCKQQYGIPVIVDIDDLLDNLMSDHPEFVYFQKNKAIDCITVADHFVTSTEYLKNVYGHLNPNITVVENAVDFRRYQHVKNAPKPHKAGFVVGWTGSQSHRPDLYNTGYIEGLAKAMREFPDIRAYFHVLCPQTLLDEFGAQVIFNPRPVDYLDWPSMCFTFPFDVCAVPLYNHPFNDAKSDLRLLDMAPFQVPVLASPRHEFRRHKEKQICFLVDDDTCDDWYKAIVSLYQNSFHTKEIGVNANQYIQAHRDSRQASDIWRQLLRRLLCQ